MSNFYCAAIHHNIRLDTTLESQVKILPCCIYRAKQQYHSLEQYYSSPEIQSLKTAVTWPDGCQVCQQQELQGQTSYRQHANHSLKNVSGVRYEIMPSNVCNLKCVMCSPVYSTALAKERHTIGITNVDLSKETNTSQAQLTLLAKANNIESISVIGGEFFLTKDNLKIMDFVIENSIPFRVVTNATVLLDSHMERLKKINSLELQISIDGHNEGYEIMRYPAKWSTFSNNVSRLITELPNAKINFNFVAQVLNIQQLVPTLAWCNELNTPTRITNLVQPKFLGWSVFSNQEKIAMVELLQYQCETTAISQSQQQDIASLCQTIMSVDHDVSARQEFEFTVGKIYQHRWPNLLKADAHHQLNKHVFYPINT